MADKTLHPNESENMNTWDQYAAAASLPAALVDEELSYWRNEGGSLPAPGGSGYSAYLGSLATREAEYRARVADELTGRRPRPERNEPTAAARAMMTSRGPDDGDPFLPEDEPTGLDLALEPEADPFRGRELYAAGNALIDALMKRFPAATNEPEFVALAEILAKVDKYVQEVFLTLNTKETYAT